MPIGRNQPCPCGSGDRFKNCHGRLAIEASPPDSSVSRLQRERQQGKGRPIISHFNADRRIVTVGSKQLGGSWKTFHEFLMFYIRKTLGMEWGQRELEKPAEDRHPILNWYQGLCRLQAEHATGESLPYSAPMIGVARAYLGLAYDLYTLEHNEGERVRPHVRLRLLARLRHPDQFIGARYEVRIAAMLLRAGFSLEWEDETDGTQDHGEFVATFPDTQKRFWVECKIRQPDPAKAASKGLGKFLALVSAALRKTTSMDRLVCVDLNTPAKPRVSADASDWRDWAVGRLRMLEGSSEGERLPPALIMITNVPEHHHLDTFMPDAGAVLEGFNMDDWRLGKQVTLREAIEHRERHSEMKALVDSVVEHQEIPATFDGAIPELEGSQRRLLIGQWYELGAGRIGELVEACVVETTKAASCIFRMEDGTQVMVQLPLTPEELSAWKRYPETFFGVLRKAQKAIQNPMDLFEFFLASCAETPKEKLLQLMEAEGDESLAALSQRELALVYAERLTNGALAASEPFETPEWMQRLRPPPKRGK